MTCRRSVFLIDIINHSFNSVLLLCIFHGLGNLHHFRHQSSLCLVDSLTQISSYLLDYLHHYKAVICSTPHAGWKKFIDFIVSDLKISTTRLSTSRIWSFESLFGLEELAAASASKAGVDQICHLPQMAFWSRKDQVSLGNVPIRAVETSSAINSGSFASTLRKLIWDPGKDD